MGERVGVSWFLPVPVLSRHDPFRGEQWSGASLSLFPCDEFFTLLERQLQAERERPRVCPVLVHSLNGPNNKGHPGQSRIQECMQRPKDSGHLM